MTAHFARLRESRSWWFDLIVFCLGGATLAITLFVTGLAGWEHHALLTVVAVPLIVVMARFPMVLDGRRHGIEVGFDSTVLMFLLCTFETHDALIAWSIGVIVTQVTTGKRLSSKLFNTGVGILAGSYAAGVFLLLGGPTAEGTPRELLAVALAAACYFGTDFVLSALSVAIATGSGVRSQIVRRGTVLAVACFVPFDLLGYLAAVVHRTTPWWTLSLLVVPLVTLLIATRALTRGREHARRLTVLFDAAVRAQTLTDPDQVVDALLGDARELVRLSDVPLRREPPARGEIGARVQRDGHEEWVVARATDRARSTVADDEQALRALAAVASEAFGRIALTADRVHVARHDPLTDLPNRGILLDRLDHAFELSRRHGTRTALLFIDLDRFKSINDRFGHSAGDAVLVELAGRLLDSVRSSDTVARLGGDEFAVLLEDVDGRHLDDLCERILRSVNSGVQVAGQQVQMGASIGLAYGDADVSAAALLRNADLAMYEAKARGRGQCVRYEESIGRARMDRLELVDDLSRALDAREIAVHYQPVVDSVTGRIIGAEALARWRRDGVPVPPDVFIPVAEETGQIMALGDLVLDTVVADSAALRDAAGEPIQLGINVSPRQLREPAFIDSVRRALDAMAGTSLILEITEREGINADCGVLDAMHTLSELGVRFAIDDFGVGFSSISYLHDLPADVIKVDAALSRDMDRDERSDALLRSVTLMGHTLGLEVVVEGIERETQLQMLRDAEHPVLAQGYLLHRPMPVGELVDVLRDADVPDIALAPIA